MLRFSPAPRLPVHVWGRSVRYAKSSQAPRLHRYVSARAPLSAKLKIDFEAETGTIAPRRPESHSFVAVRSTYFSLQTARRQVRRNQESRGGQSRTPGREQTRCSLFQHLLFQTQRGAACPARAPPHGRQRFFVHARRSANPA